MKEQDSTKMEFLLTLNDNIVVQRFFNVRGFNPDAKNSLELYYYMKQLKDELQYHLKMKTVIYMIDTYIINQVISIQTLSTCKGTLS
jgi:hypothetical protein